MEKMTKADYIKREDALNALCDICVDKLICDKAYQTKCHKKFMDIPAADVRENVRGDWVGEADGYADGSLVYDMWYCSHCGYRCEDDEPPKWNYCPICGADMRGEKDE